MVSTLSGLDIICVQFLFSVWTAAVALTIAAVLIVFRRRGVIRGIRYGVSVVLAVMVASAASVNAHYAYLPTAGDVGDAVTSNRQWVALSTLARLSPASVTRAEHGGLIVREPLGPDPADGFGATNNVVYLPPQYFLHANERFPVVYLFHGTPGEPADWMHAGRAQRVGFAVAALGRPVIMVAPQMSRAWTDDPECVDGAREKVETHLLRRVIPTIDATFRTMPNRIQRIFAGMSAGGYCALNLGLRHRNLVASIIDMSGETKPTHTGGAATLFGKHNPAGASLVAENSPQLYASMLNPAGPPEHIWLDSGTHDTTVLQHLTTLGEQLRNRGIDVRWRVRSGGHTYWVWRAALTEALPWALGLLPGHPHLQSHPGPTA